MSLQKKGFWMAKDAGFLSDGEMAYDNSSRIEPKRAHQWFIDPTESDLFPNKKQAVEASNKSISELPNVNVSPWENASSFQSVPGHFTDRLFGSEMTRTVNFGDRNIPSVGTGNLNLGRKGIEDQFGNDSSVGLSMSHTMEDPGSCLSYGGIRKVKVNQVEDSDNGMHVSMGHTYNRGDNNTMPMGLTFNKVDDNSMSMGHTLTYNKEDNNIISVGQTYNRGDDDIILMGHTFNKGSDNTISTGHVYNKGDTNIISMGHTYNKGDPNTISFGGFHDEPETYTSGRLISSYDLLMGQSPAQTSEVLSEKDLVELNDDIEGNAQITNSGTKTISKNKMELKMSKKVAPHNFPSNVRNLISTGMLDGVPIKYVSWSREELRGIIKGSGYLCGCQSCSFSKILNAYEFENHAGCKTRLPNKRIFFESGKTIYEIVQELRSTPQDLLFEVILNVTGSPINQKSFRIWKESFLAATRELRRIYGKEKVSPTTNEDS